MAKDLTTKDVLYALEYLGDAMERQDSGKWVMASSRAPIRDGVVNEVRASGFVVGTGKRVIWVRAA